MKGVNKNEHNIIRDSYRLSVLRLLSRLNCSEGVEMETAKNEICRYR